MKLLQPLIFCVLCLAACTNSSQQNTTGSADTIKPDTASLVETLCFQRTEGLKNQDTSYVQLVINGDKITGVFAHLPYEKDSRIGTLLGTKQDNLIKGMWVYMQEGMQDTLDVEFKLDNNKLLQKSYSIDTKTGTQFLSDTSVFRTEYSSIDCSTLPERLKPH